MDCGREPGSNVLGGWVAGGRLIGISNLAQSAEGFTVFSHFWPGVDIFSIIKKTPRGGS